MLGLKDGMAEHTAVGALIMSWPWPFYQTHKSLPMSTRGYTLEPHTLCLELWLSHTCVSEL